MEDLEKLLEKQAGRLSSKPLFVLIPIFIDIGTLAYVTSLC
jgi:hypothetical protein